jgi:hypothetical protein
MENYSTSLRTASKQAFEVAGAVNYSKNPDFILLRAIKDQMFGESGDRHPSNILKFVSTEAAFCA